MAQGASNPCLSMVKNLVAGPVAVPGAPPVRHLSLRLDPALYADRSVSVVISETQGYDAQVAEIALYDVDYRYADAGGGGDVQYPGPLGVLGRAYGWLDGVSFTTWGTLPYQSRRSDTADSDPSDDPDSELRYRFDGLNPAKQYRLQMSFYHQFGTLPDQFVAVDGTVVVPPTTLPASVTTVFSPTVPPGRLWRGRFDHRVYNPHECNGQCLHQRDRSRRRSRWTGRTLRTRSRSHCSLAGI